MDGFVIGADEVGLGSWAGPLVVCSAILPDGFTVRDLDDSKKLTKNYKKLIEVYDRLMSLKPFVKFFLEWYWPEDIDKEGVGRCRIAAFRHTVKQARAEEPQARIVLDGDLKLYGIEHEAFPKADTLVPAVMAASVVAKVERDRWMHTEGDSEFPQYDFIHNVGYGVPKHIAALNEHGPCRIHRYSYRPVRERVRPILDEETRARLAMLRFRKDETGSDSAMMP